MLETSVHTREWFEILVRTCDLMMRNLEEMLREPFDTVDVLVIYICKRGTRRSEELRMVATWGATSYGWRCGYVEAALWKALRLPSASQSPSLQ